MSAACPILGFTLRCTLRSPLDEHGESALTDDFLELTTSRGLVCSGGFSGMRWSMTVHSEASQATDSDRVALEEWAARRPEIANAHTGPLVDLDP